MAPPCRGLLVLGVLVATCRAYDQQLGIKMAWLEKAVYCGEDRFSRWDVGQTLLYGPRVDASKVRFVVSADEAAAGIGRMTEPDGCFVAVRGTLGKIPTMFDAMFWEEDFGRPSCGGCRVHFGFKASYDSLRSGIFEALDEFGCADRPLYLTGHSMGAAMATYLLYDVLEAGHSVKLVHAMESPRPGNSKFAAAVQRKMRDGGVTAWRIVHYKDIVPHVPPRGLFDYTHALREIYYTTSNTTKYRECGVEDAGCSDQWSLWQCSPDYHMWFANMNPCGCADMPATTPKPAPVILS